MKLLPGVNYPDSGIINFAVVTYDNIREKVRKQTVTVYLAIVLITKFFSKSNPNFKDN